MYQHSPQLARKTQIIIMVATIVVALLAFAISVVFFGKDDADRATPQAGESVYDEGVRIFPPPALHDARLSMALEILLKDAQQLKQDIEAVDCPIPPDGETEPTSQQVDELHHEADERLRKLRAGRDELLSISNLSRIEEDAALRALRDEGLDAQGDVQTAVDNIFRRC